MFQEQAIALFNFLASDNRWVMAAMLPRETERFNAATKDMRLGSLVKDRLMKQIASVKEQQEEEDDEQLEQLDTSNDGNSIAVSVNSAYSGGLKSPLGAGGSYGDEIKRATHWRDRKNDSNEDTGKKPK